MFSAKANGVQYSAPVGANYICSGLTYGYCRFPVLGQARLYLHEVRKAG